MLEARTYQSPVGPLTVVVDPARQAVAAAGFCRPGDLVDRIPGDREWRAVDRQPLTDKAIEAYLDGDLPALDDIPVVQPGTELQKEVWDGLRRISAGSTATYTELAQATSKPKAVRAVGSACGRNLVAPIVPCHRALRSDGTLGGYYYGLDVKRWLLDHEAANA
jgi:methylated-DNA-[protein]-cysteine S-methyltransferase